MPRTTGSPIQAQSRGRYVERERTTEEATNEPPSLSTCSHLHSQDADEVVQVENAYYSAKGA